MTPLEKSIAHWERMRDFTELSQFHTESIGQQFCALCAEFINVDCIGCPVSRRTGVPHCDKTPYRDKVTGAMRKLRQCQNDDAWEEWRQATQAEIDFLRLLH